MDQELRSAYEDLLSAVSKMHYLSHLTRHLVEGVTPVEMRVLVVVLFSTEREEEVRPSLLSSSLGTTKSALSQVLRSLEDKGLISRKRSERDSRAVVVELTEKGQDHLEQIHDECDREMSELVDYIGLDDLRYLKRTVDRITDFYRDKADGQGRTSEEISGDSLMSMPPMALYRKVKSSMKDGDGHPCA